MLSRLHPRAGLQGLLQCKGQFTVPAAATSSLPQESSQRDLVNFPRIKMLEKTPETRFGFVPKSWFDFLYPKTGVTGPYMLMTGVGTYLLSKELLVVNGEFYIALSFMLVVWFIQKKMGPKISDYAESEQKKLLEEINESQARAKNNIRDNIKMNEQQKWQIEGIMQYLPETKRENVQLQMEAEYRSRLQTAYAKVKSHLDYIVEKQAIERRISQKNMVDWVVRNVESSMTPQLKKNALKQCIADLKGLAARS